MQFLWSKKGKKKRGGTSGCFLGFRVLGKRSWLFVYNQNAAGAKWGGRENREEGGKEKGEKCLTNTKRKFPPLTFLFSRVFAKKGGGL